MYVKLNIFRINLLKIILRFIGKIWNGHHCNFMWLFKTSSNFKWKITQASSWHFVFLIYFSDESCKFNKLQNEEFWSPQLFGQNLSFGPSERKRHSNFEFMASLISWFFNFLSIHVKSLAWNILFRLFGPLKPRPPNFIR